MTTPPASASSTMPAWIASTRAASACPGETGSAWAGTARPPGAGGAAAAAAAAAVGAGVAEDISPSVVARGPALKRPGGQVAPGGCR